MLTHLEKLTRRNPCCMTSDLAQLEVLTHLPTLERLSLVKISGLPLQRKTWMSSEPCCKS